MDIPEQKYELVEVDQLTPHPENVNEGDVGEIGVSIEKNGWFGAVLANPRTGRILAGKHRWLAAKQKGAKKVPTLWRLCETDEEEVRVMLACNQTTRLGRDDSTKLADLLTELAKTPVGLLGTGFSGDDLDLLLSDLAGPTFEPATEAEQGRLDEKKPIICPACGHVF